MTGLAFKRIANIVGQAQKYFLLFKSFFFFFLSRSVKLEIVSRMVKEGDFLLLKPLPKKPWFLRVCSKRLLTTLWEKEKLLISSDFSFSHSVLYPFNNFLQFSSTLKLSSADYFSLEESKI